MLSFSISQSQKYQIFIFTALIATSSLAIFSYLPGLSGPFILDDINNLQPLNNDGGVTNISSLLNFVFGNRSGDLGRPVSMLSFLINDQHYPGDPASYKYTNILLHVLCGALIFLLIYKLLIISGNHHNNSLIIALIVTSIWLLHPFNVSTVLYVIQRMTQLMTIFTIAGLIFYLYGREKIGTNTKHGILLISCSLIPCGILGVFSKENGFLIITYILLIEFLIFNDNNRPKALKIWLAIFIYLPLAVFTLYIFYRWDGFLASYAHRDFDVGERLLTETRIISEYLYRILAPSSSGSGIFHDDYQVSTSLFHPITTLTSILFLFTLAGAAYKIRKKYPLLTLSIALFFSAHLLESTIIPLELYFEHRNYFPMIGVLLGTSLAVHYTINNYLAKYNIKKYIASVFIILIFMLSSVTHQSSMIWGDAFKFLSVAAYEHPNSLRAHSIYGRYLSKIGAHEKAIDILKRIYTLHPNDIAVALLIYNISCKNNLLPPYTFEHLIDFSKNSTYSGHFTSIANNFIEINKTKKCFGYTNEAFHKVLYALADVKSVRGTALIELLLRHADVYVSDGNLDMAMNTLDRAFQYKNLPIIALRQVEILASAGLYEEALLYLKRARNTNRKGIFFSGFSESYYDNLETKIIAMIQQGISNNERL